ncbi:hypothetical protein NL676_012324 [Syzygium grande]|nr:hypothetical protein NL676_012324 [Syzygium grande]
MALWGQAGGHTAPAGFVVSPAQKQGSGWSWRLRMVEREVVRARLAGGGGARQWTAAAWHRRPRPAMLLSASLGTGWPGGRNVGKLVDGPDGAKGIVAAAAGPQPGGVGVRRNAMAVMQNRQRKERRGEDDREGESVSGERD